MLKPPEIFVTARLTGRPPRLDDAEPAFQAYASDAAVTRYLSWKAYERVEPLRTFLAESISHWGKSDGTYAWMLCLKGTDWPIGSLGVVLGEGKALFGYVLAKKFWGRGFTTEALQCLVDWSLAQPEIGRAWAFCDTENPASARVMEKCGMQREGILRRWHRSPTLGENLRDCIVCAKVR